MRMRRKKHLDERLTACGDMLIYFEPREIYGRPEKKNYPDINLKEVFSNDNPVFLEIGSGKGGFINTLAKNNPDINYIGFEKDDNVLVSAIEGAIELGLKNVKYVICEAEQLDFLFKENSFDGLYLNFSCPYPKGTYANRRLTNPKFLRVYANILKEGAFVFQKTDNRPFFDYSVECFLSSGYEIVELTYDLYNSEFINGNIATEYEKKFVELNKPICRLKAKFVGEDKK